MTDTEIKETCCICHKAKQGEKKCECTAAANMNAKPWEYDQPYDSGSGV